MKRLFLSIAILLLAQFACIGTHAEHLEFHRIPMSGTISDFVEKLGEKGYTFDQYFKQTAILNGQFAGQDVTLNVYCTNTTNTVWKVEVYFPIKHGWEDLKKYYTDFKRLYTNKYGTPADHVEAFPKGYEEGNGYEVFVLKADRCTYRSRFKLPHGLITVRLDKSERLVIVYEDKEGTDLAPLEMMDDL